MSYTDLNEYVSEVSDLVVWQSWAPWLLGVSVVLAVDAITSEVCWPSGGEASGKDGSLDKQWTRALM